MIMWVFLFPKIKPFCFISICSKIFKFLTQSESRDFPSVLNFKIADTILKKMESVAVDLMMFATWSQIPSI